MEVHCLTQTKNKVMHLKILCTAALFKRGALTKTLRVMKITTIILFAACLQVSAKGVSQTITLNERNVPLQKIFVEIHKQTGFEFFYKDELLKQAGKVN